MPLSLPKSWRPFVLVSSTLLILGTLTPTHATSPVVPTLDNEKNSHLSDEMPSEEKEATVFQPMTDRIHSLSSQALLRLTERIDTFFLRENEQEEANRTQMRLRSGLQFAEGGDVTLLQRVRLNLHLPSAERRLDFFLEQTGDYLDPESQVFNETGGGTGNFTIFTGLRYLITDNPLYSVDTQVGVRFTGGLVPFTQLRGYNRIPMGRWSLKPMEILFWRLDRGFGETSRFDLDHQLSESTLLRLRAEGTYAEVSNGYEYSSAIIYAQQLQMKKGFQLSLGLAGETRPQRRIVHYLAEYAWRQRIHRDWLFLEAIADLYFYEDRDFRPTPVFILLFEANFGHEDAPLTPTEIDESSP
ncbi:MAG: hypothetical protein C0621_00765 [Desulfuromonas sp.]|nr:MAG: hypothetical protein C0621_00765 [Desulfuromonas sp.]